MNYIVIIIKKTGIAGNSKKGTIDDKEAVKSETDFFPFLSLLSIALQNDIDLNNF